MHRSSISELRSDERALRFDALESKNDVMGHRTDGSPLQKRDSRFQNARSVLPIAVLETQHVFPETKNDLSQNQKIESVTQHVESETRHVEWVTQDALLSDTINRFQLRERVSWAPL